jgi:fluoride exporter
MLAGTGIAGGLSTFSSFAYAVAMLMTASTANAVVASAFVVISLLLGYVAVVVGLKLGSHATS